MNEVIFFFFYNFAHDPKFIDAKINFLAVYFIYVVIALAFLFLSRRFIQNFKQESLGLFYKLREFILVFTSAGLAWGLAKILKILIHTDRPFEVFKEIEPLFRETGYAFPSGHSAVAAAIAFALFFINKKTGYVFMFFALIIGIARIVAGVHFPIDILGGFALGATVSYLVAYSIAYFRKNVYPHT